ncbi:MAG: glycyl-radical enzyme activating protein [Rectinemataceae bacterium]|nr:glycyl-radical enzyme activating protein [Rectinemataceae bacterium]
MIFDIQRFSTHDGPGIRTVVFFKGCPLSCAWCENPESQSSGPELLYTRSRCVGCASCVAAAAGTAIRSDPAGGILIDRDVEPPPALGAACPALALRIAGREAGADEIMAEVLKDRSFFARSGGGLTLSGGEPLAQIDLAMSLFEAALAEGIDIAIESCLSVGRKAVKRAASLPLHWLADLKHTDAAAFRAGTGGDVTLPLANLEYLAGRCLGLGLGIGADLAIRVPIIPGFNDDESSMAGILQFAAGLQRPASGLRRVDLLPYHDLAAGKYAALGRSYAFPPGTKVESATIATYAELGRSLGLEISIGG